MSYATTILSDAPLVYYRLDDAAGTAAADASGHARAGTYAGGYTLARPGAIADGNRAAAFDGSSGQVSIPSASIVALTAFTVEAWAYRTRAGAVQRTASVVGSSAGGWGVGYSSSNNHLFTKFGVVDIIAPVASAAGPWEHVVWTIAADRKARLYVNGALAYTDADTSAVLAATGTADLASLGATQFFGGTLDEVAVYATALSAARIATHYRAGKGLLTPRRLLASGHYQT